MTAFTTTTFRAMGSSCHITADVGHGALSRARRRVEHLERKWSRFLPDSDVTHLNHAAGAPVRVDPSTIRLLTAMVQGWRATGGSFDPTLLVTMIGLGYSCSWDDPSRITSLPAGARLQGDPDSIAVDPVANIAQLPPGTAIDAGGIGKGLAADIVADELLGGGASGALVSIGGDLRATGMSPKDGGWVVRCDKPDGEGIRLLEGGIATSGTDVRGHHVVDPHCGAPSQLVREATVVAGTAWWAEVFTKVVMVVGAASGLRSLEAQGLAARVSYVDGRVERNDAWKVIAA